MDSDLLTLDLHQDMNIAGLKGVIEEETRYAITSQHLYHNGQLLTDDSRTLQELGIGEGEMLAMHVRDMVGETGVPPASRGLAGSAPGRGSSSQRPRGQGASSSTRGLGGGSGGPDPEMIRLQILGNPRMLAEIRNQYPGLAAAVNDSGQFGNEFRSMERQQVEAEGNRRREISMLNEDPFNRENQAKIEELIRQEAVMENLQNALEHNPEGMYFHYSTFEPTTDTRTYVAFGKVHMLYIDVEVNGHKVKAFVDSGAQATIMSPSCATACGIMRLVDTRFAGIARGVGTAKILGRVHSAQIKIGSLFLACSFTVMEGKDVDLLLGLDMLKRHQACIDLQKDRLVIQDVDVPFLGEADIPKSQEELLDEPTVEGPGGAKVGARTGAVLQPPGTVPTQASSSRGSSSGGGSSHGRGQTPGVPQVESIGRDRAQPTLSRSPQLQHPPEAIEQLLQLGVSREEAIAALNATGGNVDFAAGLFFQDR
ncbi:MAG: DNA damage-inducible protein 1 [Geoglossum simile]|nr:MAG: DNA damage-inducible protein 1 [Geoglossum simile]